MRKQNRGWLVCVIFALLMAWTAPAQSADMDAATCRIGVEVKVRCTKQGCEMQTSFGSGALIAKGRVLTCSHLFDDGMDKLTVYFGGKPYPAKLLKRCGKADLALLSVPDDLPIKPTGWTDRIDESAVVYLRGYGSGDYKQTAGKFAGWATPVDGQQTYFVGVKIRQGDSGGPAFNAQGVLVGVQWGCNDKAAISGGRPLVEFLYPQN